MLHGVGSDGNDLISLVPFIQQSLPNYHFIAPDGAEPYDMAPFGRQWFSLQDRSPQVITKLLKTNVDKVQNIIESKQQKLGIENKDTILLGFSQGTMMASYLTLFQKNPYSALIAFSGMLIPPPILNNTQTPICIIHGLEDEVVLVNESKYFAAYCKENNIDHQLKLVPNLNHSIDASGIEFAINFLKTLNKP
jgi:phospholipase/carboxylesterase